MVKSKGDKENRANDHVSKSLTGSMKEFNTEQDNPNEL